MFNRKKIKRLEEENIKLYKEIERLNNKIDDLKTDNEIYKEQIAKLKLELENKYKEYDYAILVNGVEVKLWNKGRFEKRVRGITFNCYECEVPELTITK